MRTVVLLLVVIAAIALAVYLVVQNRASEKILTAVIPITVAATVGIFLSVFVFGGQPALTLVFPVSFQYQLKSKMPANLPWALRNRRFHDFVMPPAALAQKHPEYFSDAADGHVLYHELLQLGIVEWMSLHYHNSWESEAMTFELPSGRYGMMGPSEGATKSSKFLSKVDLEMLMNGNRFAESHVGIPLKIALPPGTDTKIVPPKSDSGEIILQNGFCTLSIRTTFSSYLTGIGALGSLAGLTQDQDRELGTANYLVRITATYNRYRSGHPDMPLYVTWATGIAEGLKDQFDEEQIWSRTKADYIFSKQVEQFGPARDAPPPRQEDQH